MTIEDILNDARSVVKKVVPDHVEITQVDFEGPTIVIYTKNMEVFAESNDLVRQIAQQLRRRIVVRPDPSLLASQDDAEKVIREVIPAEAQITGIYFETETGEVTIEALSPGMGIGRHGSVLNEIKKKIGWAPKVVRTPPIPSKTVEEIRQYLRTINDERQAFLKQVGRRLAREVPQGENYVRITALGGFRQVGRSAALLSTRESKVLIDCGVLISEDNGSPYLNAPEVLPLSSLDAVVITHAHLDHSGLVPALFKYGYEGPIYTTPPTRPDPRREGPGPRVRRRPFPGGHARPRGRDAEPPDSRGPDLPGRHDLGGDRDPYRVPGVPEQPAADADLPDRGEPVPQPHVQAGRDGGHAREHRGRRGAVHRPRDLGHDVRWSCPGVLQGLGGQPAPRPPVRRLPVGRLPRPTDPAGGPGDHAHGPRAAAHVADQVGHRDDRRILRPLGPASVVELRRDDGAAAGARHREPRRGVRVLRPGVRLVQEIRARDACADESRDDPPQVILDEWF